MNYKTLTFIALILSITSFAQNSKILVKSDELIIPINTEFKIRAKENNGKILNYELITESKISGPIDMMSVLQKTEKKIISNEIEFKFSKADFMGSKLIILTTLQHFTKPIIFEAKIRLKGTEKYIETSIVPKALMYFRLNNGMMILTRL
jgi:hypothetical protein